MGKLTSPDTLVVFTTSPTGLGHIRVMDALLDGKPPEVETYEVGIENVRANKIHSMGSRIPILTKITEFYQTNPLAEWVVAGIVISYLRRNKRQVMEEFAKVAGEFPKKKIWVVIATHYALAHTIAGAKPDLEKKYGVRVVLCVVVTDDSPQRVWAVPEADLIFAPSVVTQQRLIRLLGNKTDGRVKAISFPLSPRLSQPLSGDEFRRINDQLSPDSNFPLHVDIPISGAAVQIDYFDRLIRVLADQHTIFTVIGQDNLFTHFFFESLRKIPRVQLSVGNNAKETVRLYESLFYQGNRPAIEITKPSEQTFKALISPGKRGGVILLLTEPVGRQERDNLNFLIRHRLMPDKNDQRELERALEKPAIEGQELSMILYKASHYRAIRLPDDPQRAAVFIRKLTESGIFLAMLSYVAESKEELTSMGVSQIWKAIDDFLLAW